jgi:hypothetical protein
MARRTRRRRTRRHRMPGRGRGGRFVSRSRRSRRRRRNPVVPVSWNPGRRRRRRSRSRRRNPLFLSRKGFAGRKHKGYRRLHRRRRSPRYWHNPVVPVSWNPRRRRSHRRRRSSGRRRSYRRNAVLPFFAFNPGGSASIVNDVMNRAKSLIDIKFWTETGIPAAGGFFGSKALGGLLHQYTLTQFAGIGPTSAYYPYTKAVADTVAGAVMAWATSRFYSKKAGDAIWLGTVVNVAYSLIRQVMNQFAPGLAASIGLSGLGNDLSDRMKDAVTQRVRASLSGYLTTGELRRNLVRPMGAYATEMNVRRDSYDPSPRGDLRDYDVASTETAL